MREDIIRNGSNVQKRNEMFSELAGGSLNNNGTLTQKAGNLRDPDLGDTRYQFLSDPGLYREDEPDTTGLDQTQRQLLHTARVLNNLGPGNGTNFTRADENALITDLANNFINFAGTMSGSANRVENFAANIDAIVRGFEATRRHIRNLKILGLTILGALSIVVGVVLTNCNTNKYQAQSTPTPTLTEEAYNTSGLSVEENAALREEFDKGNSGNPVIQGAVYAQENSNGVSYSELNESQKARTITAAAKYITIDKETFNQAVEDMIVPGDFIERMGSGINDKNRDTYVDEYLSALAGKFIKEGKSLEDMRSDLIPEEDNEFNKWNQGDNFKRLEKKYNELNNADNTNTGNSVVNNLGNGQYGGSKVQPLVQTEMLVANKINDSHGKA